LQVATAIEAGVTKIRAPEVWAAGFTGQGIVIGGQDTGYQWDHPALLKGKYRVTERCHRQSQLSLARRHPLRRWVCGANSTVPCDDHYIGTHTMGTMVGDDGASNQTGVAPGAKWIGCRNMNQGNGTPATYANASSGLWRRPA
jgi:subtilisin family serine protease